MESEAKKTPSLWKGALEFTIILAGCMAAILVAVNAPPLVDLASDYWKELSNGTISFFNN